MHTLSAGLTDLGKERDSNEDSFVADDELGFYAVSDGMGGHAAGEVASALAIESALAVVTNHRSALNQIKAGTADPSRLIQIAHQAVEEACRAVYRKANATGAMRGMGCTLTLVVSAGPHAALGHVGDSRCYLIRSDQVHQLSTDHTIAGELARAGVIQADEVKEHRYANALSRAIGPQEAVQVETLAFTLSPGDTLLLCSDGLSEYVEQQWIASQVAQEDLNVVVDALIEHANRSGGRDNITAVVVRAGDSTGANTVVVSIAEDVQIQIDAIASVPAFAGLPLGHLSRALSHCRVVSFAAGEKAFSPGQEWSALTIVLNGTFSLTADEANWRTLRPGDFLGASTLLAARTTSSTLEATEAGRLLVLDHASFERLTRERPWLGVALLTRIGRQLAMDLDRMQRKYIGEGETLASSESF